MKWCPQCEDEKSVDDFAKNRAKKDGRASQCKACKKIYQDDWYRRNRKKHIATTRVVRDRRRSENREGIADYLAEHPCVDCGTNDQRVLDFDHVRGTKKADVSRLVNDGYSWEVVEAEIAKCEVRCANCHRIKTAERRR